MPTARPFAYNTGAPIPGTIQVGSLAIGTPTSGFTDTPQFWNGPDEELGYVICVPIADYNQPTPISGVTAAIGFYRSSALTENSFVILVNNTFNQNFTNGFDASYWLYYMGYWTSYAPNIVPMNWWFIGNAGATECLNPIQSMVVRYKNSDGTYTDATLQVSSNNGYILVSGATDYTPTRVSGQSAAYFDLRNLGTFNPIGCYTFKPSLTNISTTRTVTYVDCNGNNQTLILTPSFTNTTITANRIISWQGGICDN